MLMSKCSGPHQSFCWREMFVVINASPHEFGTTDIWPFGCRRKENSLSWIYNVLQFCSYHSVWFKLRYDFQQSDTINIPGSINYLIIGKSLASLLSSTATTKHFFESSSIPPNTHCPSTLFPQWNSHFSTLLSSICTTFPSPPIFSLFCKIVTSQVLL